MLLTKKGFDSTIAGSGEEAIQILRPPWHGRADIKMEGMDGQAALSEIKKISPETQVIMLTGRGTPDSAASSRKLTAFNFLAKHGLPFPLLQEF